MFILCCERYSQINFTKNHNGKLFCDVFGDICIKDADYQEGVEYEILLNGQSLGTAYLYCIRNFPALRLTEAASQLNSGNSPAELRASLSRQKFGHMQMPDDVMLSHLIFRYNERNFQTQSTILKNWWADKSNTLWNQS